MSFKILRIEGAQWQTKAGPKGHGLLMTATLTPPAAAVARHNPVERLADYMQALHHYLGLPNAIVDRILFVDNSNSDLTPLINMATRLVHGKAVEFISFAGNDHDYHLGKAYGEFKLMDFGMANTSLFEPHDLIWKTTGRLKILNFEDLTQHCKNLTFDVLCDLHNLPWVGSGNWHQRHHMDLRVFAFRQSAYNSVFGGLWRTQTTVLDAEFFYHRVRKSYNDVQVIPRFPVQLQLQGISGRHQRDYATRTQRAKDAVRRVSRKLAPWLWL